MEMHQIRYFLSVSETLNFRQAASNCHVSQPALTRAIKKLEAELGGELLRRERLRTHLTELGHSMLPLLRQSYESASAAKAEAERHRRADIAPLSLGLSSSISIEVLLPALDELSGVLPGLELHLDRGDASTVLTALENGTIELGVAAVTGDPWERIDRYPLFSEDFVIITPTDHPFAEQRAVTVESLRGFHILGRRYCEHHQSLERALKKRSVSFSSPHRPASESDLMALVGRGLGLGIVPRSTNVACNLAAVPLKNLGLSRVVALHSVAGRQHSAAAARLLGLLRAANWSAYEGNDNLSKIWAVAPKLSAGLSIDLPVSQIAANRPAPHVVDQQVLRRTSH